MINSFHDRFCIAWPLRTAGNRRLVSSTVVGIALALLPVHASAQINRTWDGSTSTDWSNNSNWSGNNVPDTAGETASVNNGALGNQPNLDANFTVGQVLVSAGTLSISSTLTTVHPTLPGTVVTGGLVNVNLGGQISGSVETGPAGTLSVSGSLVGNVSNAGTLQLFGPSFVNGDVSSSGLGTNSGQISGTLDVTGGTFNNAGIIGGATTIFGGTLNMDAGSDLSDTSAFTVNGGTVNVNASDTVGSLSGSGGQIDIDAGQILTVTQSVDESYSGNISGTGTLTKAGTSTVTLTGANALIGATNVAAGTLIVDGSLGSSAITVASGGTVGGTGTLGATTVQSGGTISPGTGGIGTLSTGQLTLNANSTTLIEVQGAFADRINVTGDANLAGALNLVSLGGPFNFGTPYTIINAAGNVNGTFDTVSNGLGVTVTTTYGINDVNIGLTPNDLAPIVAGGATGNQLAVARGLDAAVAGGANPSFLLPIYSQPTAAGIRAGLDQLSGEVHTTTAATAFQASTGFLTAMLDANRTGGLGSAPASGQSGGPSYHSMSRLGMGPDDVDESPTGRRDGVWVTALGGGAEIDGNLAAGSADRSDRFGSIAAGADMVFAPGIMGGLAVSGSMAQSDLSAGRGSADTDIFQAGLYGLARFGALTLGVAGAYGHLETDSARAIPVLGIANARADYGADVWSGRVEGAWAAYNQASFVMSPFAAVQGLSVENDAFTETGAGGASLTTNGTSNEILRSELGLRLDGRGIWAGMAVSGFARAAWAHYLENDANFSASLVGLPGATFTVVGARFAQDSALLSTGFDVFVTPDMTVGARLDGEWSDDVAALSGSGRFGIRF